MIETETPAERRLRAFGSRPYKFTNALTAERSRAVEIGADAIRLLAEWTTPMPEGWVAKRRALLARAGSDT